MEFSKSRARFRNWVLGTGGEAGSWGRDEIRNITGQMQFYAYTASGKALMGTVNSASGAFIANGTSPHTAALKTADGGATTLIFSASGDVPTGPQNVPQHIWQPVILYLGRPA